MHRHHSSLLYMSNAPSILFFTTQMLSKSTNYVASYHVIFSNPITSCQLASLNTGVHTMTCQVDSVHHIWCITPKFQFCTVAHMYITNSCATTWNEVSERMQWHINVILTFPKATQPVNSHFLQGHCQNVILQNTPYNRSGNCCFLHRKSTEYQQ
jgi:hypothetical protein